MGDRFKQHENFGCDSSDLAERFKNALVGENVQAFGECVERLEQLSANRDPAMGPAFLDCLSELEKLIALHEGTIRKWREASPKDAEMLARLIEQLGRLAVEADGEGDGND